MLVVLDSIALTAAFEIARAMQSGSQRPLAHVLDDMHFTAVMASITPLWIAIFAICDLYRVRVHGGRVSEVGRVVTAVFGGVMLLESSRPAEEGFAAMGRADLIPEFQVNQKVAEERVKLDVYYVESWSIGMDVSILARTLVSVAARKGAV